MAKQGNTVFSKSFKYREEQEDYVFKIKKKRSWWWLLLLLLPLLLLIRFEHDLTVTTLDSESDTPLEGTEVTIDYYSHCLWLWGDSTLFVDDHHHEMQQTDKEGKAVFKDIKCSVYSLIFHYANPVQIVCTSDCYNTERCDKNAHTTWHVEVKMVEKVMNLLSRIIDKETGDDLGGAQLELTYVKHGEKKVQTLTSSASGIVRISGLGPCDVIEKMQASCTGYADTVKLNVPAKDLLCESPESTFELRPLKNRFVYYVYNVDSKEPIPGAEAEVTIDDPRKPVSQSSTVTNVDGLGVGVYDDAFVMAKIAIHASKPNYNDSTLAGDYTVEQFVNLPQEKRTVWLRPMPYVVEYTVIDSLNNQPLAGVENEITVTDAAGNSETYLEISNRNGKIPVKSKEGATIQIVSRKGPDYLDKTTVVTRFGEEEVIAMAPDLQELSFRTLDAYDNTLLGNCTLSVQSTVSKVRTPKSSGTGEFVVSGLYPSEQLSILATKSGFAENGTKVSNANVLALKNADQSERDIPLEMNLPSYLKSCGTRISRGKEGESMTSEVAFAMGGAREGDVVFELDADIRPDTFYIYDGPNTDCRLILKEVVSGKKTFKVHYTRGALTIKAETSEDASYWNYFIHCPDETK